MIFAILSVLFILLLLNQLYFHTGTFRREQWNLSRLRKMPQGLECLTVGSGPALFAFDYQDSDVKGYNMAIWPEDFRYDERLLRQYHQVLSDGKRHVFHVVYLLSFAENDYLSKDTFSERYVHVLSPDQVDLPLWKYYLAKYLPICLHPLRVGKALLRIPLGRELPEDAIVEDGVGVDQRERCQAIAKGWVDTNPGLNNLQDVQGVRFFQQSFARNIQDINKVYQTAQKLGVEYYAVITPSSRYMLDNIFSKEFLEKFLFDNLRQSDIPANRLLNYLDDEEFSGLDCYTGGIFLNKASRKRFTQKVLHEVAIRESKNNGVCKE